MTEYQLSQCPIGNHEVLGSRLAEYKTVLVLVVFKYKEGVCVYRDDKGKCVVPVLEMQQNKAFPDMVDRASRDFFSAPVNTISRERLPKIIGSFADNSKKPLYHITVLLFSVADGRKPDKAEVIPSLEALLEAEVIPNLEVLPEAVQQSAFNSYISQAMGWEKTPVAA